MFPNTLATTHIREERSQNSEPHKMASKTGVEITRLKSMKESNGRVSYTMTQFANLVAQRTPLDTVLLIPVIIIFLGC